MLSNLESLYHNNITSLLENAEIVSINPLTPQSWGILKSGGHPQTPGRNCPAPLFQQSPKIQLPLFCSTSQHSRGKPSYGPLRRHNMTLRHCSIRQIRPQDFAVEIIGGFWESRLFLAYSSRDPGSLDGGSNPTTTQCRNPDTPRETISVC